MACYVKSPLINWMRPIKRCESCDVKVKCLGGPFCLKWIDYYKEQEEKRLSRVRKLCTGIALLAISLAIGYILQKCTNG